VPVRQTARWTPSRSRGCTEWTYFFCLYQETNSDSVGIYPVTFWLHVFTELCRLHTISTQLDVASSFYFQRTVIRYRHHSFVWVSSLEEESDALSFKSGWPTSSFHAYAFQKNTCTLSSTSYFTSSPCTDRCWYQNGTFISR
jgi:hypothetical protein